MSLQGQDVAGLTRLQDVTSGLFLSLSLGRWTLQRTTLGQGKGSNSTGFPAPRVELRVQQGQRCWLG